MLVVLPQALVLKPARMGSYPGRALDNQRVGGYLGSRLWLCRKKIVELSNRRLGSRDNLCTIVTAMIFEAKQQYNGHAFEAFTTLLGSVPFFSL